MAKPRMTQTMPYEREPRDSSSLMPKLSENSNDYTPTGAPNIEVG